MARQAAAMLYQAMVAVRGVAGPVTRRPLMPGVNQQKAITARVMGLHMELATSKPVGLQRLTATGASKRDQMPPLPLQIVANPVSSNTWTVTATL
jgi:hypothetical protein